MLLMLFLLLSLLFMLMHLLPRIWLHHMLLLLLLQDQVALLTLLLLWMLTARLLLLLNLCVTHWGWQVFSFCLLLRWLVAVLLMCVRWRLHCVQLQPTLVLLCSSMAVSVLFLLLMEWR